MRSHPALLPSLFVCALIGCSSSTSSDGPTDTGDDTSGGSCCPPAAKPACCMAYGGWSGSHGCESACDGMPYPSDPAWKIVKDDHGCDTWSSAGSTGPVCGGDAAPPDARSDTSETGDAGGHCCKADPAPGCCMHYGGWTSGDELACGETCDGMPNPGDPAWKLVKDEHGCDVWSSAGATGPRCGAPIDSGVDSASDADAHD